MMVAPILPVGSSDMVQPLVRGSRRVADSVRHWGKSPLRDAGVPSQDGGPGGPALQQKRTMPGVRWTRKGEVSCAWLERATTPEQVQAGPQGIDRTG